jgi:Flp pilus assembly protein TadB
MPDTRRQLDFGSWLVVIVTFALFLAAIFVKGLGHDLLLEAGVFLVSVKLIMMAYRNSVDATRLHERLDDLHAKLMRIESHLQSGHLPDTGAGPPNNELRP